MLRFRRGLVVAIVCTSVAVPATMAQAVTDGHHRVGANGSGGSGGSGTGGLYRKNIQPSPDYFEVCAQLGRKSPTCINQELAAIRHARAHDHRVTKRAMILPNNFSKLSVSKQTFVIMNLERVDRGIRPIIGMTPKLNVLSRLAASLQADPLVNNVLAHVLGIRSWASIWAGDLGPLASDYDWMYNDGYSADGSINIDCQRPGQSGCWGHRRNILNPFSGMSAVIAGVGTSKPVGQSIAALSAGIVGALPHFTYTWQQALNHGANGHRIGNAPHKAVVHHHKTVVHHKAVVHHHKAVHRHHRARHHNHHLVLVP